MTSILLVEDSPTQAATMRLLLERAGHQVIVAGDGLEAIEQLSALEDVDRPDLVVSDLQMPNLDGVGLVCELAKSFPDTPVIVTTVYGSEHLAVDALACGAVNFVPKNSLADLLAPVVHRVARWLAANRRFQPLDGYLRRPEFYFRLNNDIASVDLATEYFIETLAAAKQMSTTGCLRVATAVASALFASVCYGNLQLRDDMDVMQQLLGDDTTSSRSDALRRWLKSTGRSVDSQRLVRFKVSIGSNDTRVAVSHDGPTPIAVMNPAPGTPESFEKEQGRGWMLMTSFMDDVLLSSDGGEVTMVKKHEQAGEEAPASHARSPAT
ncbi:MAG: response regulator [Planctomycetota bacterium]